MAGTTPNTTVRLPGATTAAANTAAANTAAANNANAANNVNTDISSTLERQQQQSIAQGGAALLQAFTNKYQVQLPALAGRTSVGEAIGHMANIYNSKSKQLADISIAIADYMGVTGVANHPATVKLQQQVTNNETLNNLMKAIFEKHASSINTWTQLRT